MIFTFITLTEKEEQNLLTSSILPEVSIIHQNNLETGKIKNTETISLILKSKRFASNLDLSSEWCVPQ